MRDGRGGGGGLEALVSFLLGQERDTAEGADGTGPFEAAVESLAHYAECTLPSVNTSSVGWGERISSGTAWLRVPRLSFHLHQCTGGRYGWRALGGRP
jgi:hypothetical protein